MFDIKLSHSPLLGGKNWQGDFNRLWVFYATPFIKEPSKCMGRIEDNNTERKIIMNDERQELIMLRGTTHTLTEREGERVC